jgi:hypothetical protein
MGQLLKYTEPTIWALRKQGQKAEEAETEAQSTLYEHLMGYDPIRVVRPPEAKQNFIRKSSAENPKLNILNPATNFALIDLSSSEETQDK